MGSENDELRRRIAELEETLHRRTASEQMLGGLLERLRHAVYRMSLPDGTYEYFSPAAVEVFGYEAERFLANPSLIGEIMHPEFREHFGARWERLIRGEVDPTYEYKIVDPAGAERWISQTSTGVFDGQGRIVAIEGTCHDITERKRMEVALSESDERAWSFVRASPMGIFTYTVDDEENLIFSGANPAADRILGLDCSQFIGMTLEQAFPNLADTEIPPAYRRAALEGRPWQTEQVDYEDTQIKGAYEVHAFQTGPRRMSVMFLDITDVKRAEAEARSAQALLRAAVEQTPAGVLIADAPDVRIRIANSAALGIRGPSSRSLTEITAGDHPGNWQVFHPDGTPCGADELPLSRAVLRGEDVRNEELVIRQEDGSERWVLANAGPVYDEEGGVVAGVVVFLDITERKEHYKQRQRLEAQVQHAQKLESLGVLAGGIAHDFNNLLCGILGGADLALRQLEPEQAAHADLMMVQATAHTATELCRQLLAYSGKGRFEVEPLDLSAVIEQMSQLLRVSVAKNVTVRYDLVKDPPAAELDASQLRQIILNLVVNASEAIGGSNGVISISTGVMDCDAEYLAGASFNDDLPPGTYVFLEVSDTGCGMDAEVCSKLFDPFFTTKFTGRGLGLAATLGIVRGHQGTVKVYSEPDRGSTFKICFPASTRPAAETAAPAATEEWRASGRVLVADDDKTVRRVTRQMLEFMGFSVIEAADGVDAVREFERHRDGLVLVLLDMTMPRMSGEETFRELRRLDQSIPVLLMSGYNEQDATNRFTGKGLAGFVQKPFRTAMLREKVRLALES